jgi:cytochrome c551
MKRLWVVIALSFLLLAGCSKSNEARPTDAEGLYKLSCLACHGADLKGTSGPPVVNMSSKYSQEDIEKLILEGKGMMPGKLLSETEAATVAKWLMEK